MREQRTVGGRLPPGHKEKSISACSQDRTVPLGDEEEEEKEAQDKQVR